jgi:hypothetical protein
VSSDDRYWNRDELYKEVWSIPMWTLAKRYGISDVGLAKVCRKLTIPLPGRGYWARKQAGQKVSQDPLPEVKEKDKVLLQKPAPPKEQPTEELWADDERAQLARLEGLSPEPLLKRGDLSHPLIVQARAKLAKAHENPHGILWTAEQCLDIRVSRASLDRAIRVMAGLIAMIEAEGFSISVSNGHREETVATIYGQQIKFGLVEQVDRIQTTVAPSGGLVDRVLKYGAQPPVHREPSGKLLIEVLESWSIHKKRWRDGKTAQLEDLVPKVLAGFIRIALGRRAEEEKRAAEARERQNRIDERDRVITAIKAEKARVRALRHLAADWLRAEQLRAFISAASHAGSQHGQATEPGTPFGDWLTWAAKQADRLDPLKDSPESIVDCKLEPLDEQTWSYSYRKPPAPFRFPKPIWQIQKGG